MKRFLASGPVDRWQARCKDCTKKHQRDRYARLKAEAQFREDLKTLTQDP